MIAFITQGISLGFAAAVLPGPFQSYIINTTLTYGWRRSLPVILSPLVIDGPIILVVVFLLGQMPPGFIRGVQIVGGLFLFYIAYEAYKSLRAGVVIGQGGGAAAPTRGIFLRGLMMNLLSPGPYLFWSTVNGPLLLQALDLSLLHAAAFMFSFYSTFLLLLALTVFIFDRLRRLDARLPRGLLYVTIVILILFGLRLILVV